MDDLHTSCFDHLKILCLHNNSITNIDPLGRSKFLPFLTELYLSNNSIETLDGLSGADFSQLKIFHLFNNNIGDIKAFKTFKFTKIQKIIIYNNNIEDISAFGECFLQIDVS